MELRSLCDSGWKWLKECLGPVENYWDKERYAVHIPRHIFICVSEHFLTETLVKEGLLLLAKVEFLSYITVMIVHSSLVAVDKQKW